MGMRNTLCIDSVCEACQV